jgi:hypothetical protein
MVSQTGAEPCPSRPDDTISRENDPPCRASAADLKFPDRIAATAHPSAPNPKFAHTVRHERAPGHCGLMPANLMTLVHLSIFSAMNLANSSGEFGGTATAPRSANRCWMFGSSTAALVCLFSVAMI